MNQWLSETLNRWFSESIEINEPMYEWIDDSVNQWSVKKKSELVIPWLNESMSQFNESLAHDSGKRWFMWINEAMNGWINDWTNGWMGDQMDGWIDGWMDGSMDGWMNGHFFVELLRHCATSSLRYVFSQLLFCEQLFVMATSFVTLLWAASPASFSVASASQFFSSHNAFSSPQLQSRILHERSTLV